MLTEFQQECTAFFLKLDAEKYDRMVFGEGNTDSPAVMLIGEAPGEQEAVQRRPFVGKAGKNLDQFLDALELKREEIYISNVVKIRPTKVSPAGRLVNRPPTTEEKKLFTPWLMKEITLVRPRAIVTLGNVALQAFLENTIGNCHGQWSRAEFSAADGSIQRYPLFALYHPASIIYNQSLKTVYAEDLQTLKMTFQHPECML